MARTRKTRPRTHSQKSRSQKAAAFDLYFARKLVEELRQDTDEVRALRKAILGLLTLMGNDRRNAIVLLTYYLLLEFGPLAKSFSEHKHPLFGSIEVLLARTAAPNSRPTLFLPIDDLRELIRSERIIGVKNGATLRKGVRNLFRRTH